MIYPQIAANTRRTPSQTNHAEFFCRFLFQESCFPESVLKPGMLVVDRA